MTALPKTLAYYTLDTDGSRWIWPVAHHALGADGHSLHTSPCGWIADTGSTRTAADARAVHDATVAILGEPPLTLAQDRRADFDTRADAHAALLARVSTLLSNEWPENSRVGAAQRASREA